MSTYQRPECRSDEIDTLISGVQRYDPASAAVLEEYLSAQIKDDTYDSMANLALLKLIQFNPELVQPNDDPDSPDTITLILAKALAHQPFGPDFNLCMALCSDRMSTLLSTQDQIAAFEAATKLSTLLRQRDFPKFWSTLRSEEIYSSSFSPALESLPSFSALVRKSIAKSIAETFRSLSRSRAETWLGFSEDEKSKGENLDKFAKETMGWTVDGDSVQIPSNEANDPKATVTSETVDLSRMVRTLAQSVSV